MKIRINKHSYKFMVMGMCCMILTGCGIFDIGNQSPALVKVRCREHTFTKTSPITVREQKDSSEDHNKNLYPGPERPIRLCPKVITGGYGITKLPALSYLDNKSIKISNRKFSVSNKIVKSTRIKSASINGNYDYKKAKSQMDINLGSLALAALLLALILLLISAGSSVLLILSLISAILSIGFSIAGLFSDYDSERVLSLIVFCFWGILIIIFLIILIYYLLNPMTFSI